MRQAPLALIAMTAVALSACDSARPAAKVCTPFASAAAAPGDPSAVVDDCLHRWGYSLAAASDPADQVARAVVAACAPAMSRWNQQTLAPGGASEAAPSLMTGELTTPIAEHMSYAQGRALFYVVQARAGKCAPPAASPAASGAPASTGP